MKKIQISKEEAVALESVLEVNDGDKASVVHWHARELWTENRSCLNDLDLDTICTALYVGYEIEPCPEDKVLDFYEVNAKNHHIEYAVRHTLNLLNIQVKGINF